MADNLACIREAIGTNPVKLIAVTKNVDADSIEEAFRLGVTEFGENKVQDALKKQSDVSASTAAAINWHFIGHLQTNKVKKVVGRFSLIHSVDSLKLAEAIDAQAAKSGVTQDVLLQVKLVADESKSGFTPDELKKQLDALTSLKSIRLRGLMTITPLDASPETQRFCFTGLKLLADELSANHGVELEELSMGMTNDYVEAVGCGSTMVRLGRAVFGN